MSHWYRNIILSYTREWDHLGKEFSMNRGWRTKLRVSRGEGRRHGVWGGGGCKNCSENQEDSSLQRECSMLKSISVLFHLLCSISPTNCSAPQRLIPLERKYSTGMWLLFDCFLLGWIYFLIYVECLAQLQPTCHHPSIPCATFLPSQISHILFRNLAQWVSWNLTTTHQI